MIKLFFDNLINIFRRPATLQFPAVPAEVAPKHRGLIEFNADECIWCYKCENACPPGAIQYIRAEDGFDTYHYNPYLCIYCGDCVAACPKPDLALAQSEKLSFSTADQLISKNWYEIESESKRTKKEIKKAKRG